MEQGNNFKAIMGYQSEERLSLDKMDSKMLFKEWDNSNLQYHYKCYLGCQENSSINDTDHTMPNYKGDLTTRIHAMVYKGKFSIQKLCFQLLT